jgi:hypothetical protein
MESEEELSDREMPLSQEEYQLVNSLVFFIRR